MVQLVSLLGALTILVAYTANHFGRLGTSTLTYALLNAAGAGVLTAVAAIEEQWGFLLLEAVWSVVSLAAAARLVRDRRRAADRARPG